jgi:hypothetical protein
MYPQCGVGCSWGNARACTRYSTCSNSSHRAGTPTPPSSSSARGEHRNVPPLSSVSPVAQQHTPRPCVQVDRCRAGRRSVRVRIKVHVRPSRQAHPSDHRVSRVVHSNPIRKLPPVHHAAVGGSSIVGRGEEDVSGQKLLSGVRLYRGADGPVVLRMQPGVRRPFSAVPPEGVGAERDRARCIGLDCQQEGGVRAHLKRVPHLRNAGKYESVDSVIRERTADTHAVRLVLKRRAFAAGLEDDRPDRNVVLCRPCQSHHVATPPISIVYDDRAAWAAAAASWFIKHLTGTARPARHIV